MTSNLTSSTHTDTASVYEVPILIHIQSQSCHVLVDSNSEVVSSLLVRQVHVCRSTKKMSQYPSDDFTKVFCISKRTSYRLPLRLARLYVTQMEAAQLREQHISLFCIGFVMSM